MLAAGARPKDTKIDLMDCICLCSEVEIPMLHGRWRSEQAKNMYVKEPLESRLQSTRFFPSF